MLGDVGCCGREVVVCKARAMEVKADLYKLGGAKNRNSLFKAVNDYKEKRKECALKFNIASTMLNNLMVRELGVGVNIVETYQISDWVRGDGEEEKKIRLFEV